MRGKDQGGLTRGSSWEKKQLAGVRRGLKTSCGGAPFYCCVLCATCVFGMAFASFFFGELFGYLALEKPETSNGPPASSWRQEQEVRVWRKCTIKLGKERGGRR